MLSLSFVTFHEIDPPQKSGCFFVVLTNDLKDLILDPANRVVTTLSNHHQWKMWKLRMKP